MADGDSDAAAAGGSGKNMKGLVALLSASTVGLLIATIVLAVQKNDTAPAPAVTAPAPAAAVPEGTEADGAEVEAVAMSNVPDNTMFDIASIFMSEADNTCADTNPKFDNVDCVHLPGPQAGGNVTKGYQGGMEVDVVPNLEQYWQTKMCAVNVHWHLGAEHYSVGQYDENGKGPNGNAVLSPASDDPDDYHDGGAAAADSAGDAASNRRAAEAYGEIRGGFRCHHYDADDARFTSEYDWKHCKGMQVGETYEVHWPHSAAGACGTVNQYQTPFYDGVFCNLDLATFQTLQAQDIASAVGVQGQVFTIINDESYFYPDLMRGWIVDKVDDMGQDVAFYTGSTTGTSRNNQICSAYTPITWQVDRNCHLISASSFDKLCYDMKMQRDDMTDDLHAHGARELVKDSLMPNNMQRKLGDHDQDQDQDHDHDHDHHHDHGHDHGHNHGHVHSHEGLTAEQAHHLRTYGHYHEKAASQEWY